MTPYYEEAGIVIYHGDWRDVLPALAADPSVAFIDAPYGVGMTYGDSYSDDRDRGYESLIAATVALLPTLAPVIYVTPGKIRPPAPSAVDMVKCEMARPGCCVQEGCFYPTSGCLVGGSSQEADQ